MKIGTSADRTSRGWVVVANFCTRPTSTDALRSLALREWPGNVRELRYVAALCQEGQITEQDLAGEFFLVLYERPYFGHDFPDAIRPLAH